jgi:hypothetical protein
MGMADFLRNSTPLPAAREPDPFACRGKSVSDAWGDAGPESGAYDRRLLPLALVAALPCAFNAPGADMISYLRQIAGNETAAEDFRLNADGTLRAYSPLGAGYGCSFEDASDFPGSLAGACSCALLARDRSLGSERNCYESGR